MRFLLLAIRISFLKKDGYSPWRYKHMVPPKTSVSETQYEIDYSEDRWSM